MIIIMKLRLRSLESEDTLDLDVPDPCSLPQLRRILADRLPPPPPPSGSPSFRLSLNRADELRSPDPADSLQSLGLASGDLVYDSLGPDGFASSRGDGSSSSPDFHAGASNHHVSRGRPEAVADSEMADLVAEDARKVDASGSAEDRGNSASGSVDFNGRGVLAAVGGSVVVRSKVSEPYFLFERALADRVSKEELGRCGGKLIVMAVHAVMEESGFVALDPPATGMPADRLCGNPVSLWYSLPELVARSQGLNMPESVTLTFRSPGHFITVYGSLARANLGLPRVLAGFPRVCCLDMRDYAPTVELMRMWAKGDDNDAMEADEDGGFWSSHPVKRMFEFWRIVKDHLALPLLLDLAESVGLSLPSYFTCLPTELKLKIFESLSGVDLARVGCVCSELRYLTSSNDLWKQKYMDEFKRKRRESQGMIDWKQRFARSWKKRIGRYSFHRRFRHWMQRRR